MLLFKQFLSEDITNYLYHGTSMDHIFDILKYDMLEGRTIQQHDRFTGSKFNRVRHGDSSIKGVSLSRDIKISKRFGRIILVLDKEKLKQRYKIMPFSWYADPAQQSVLSSQTGARTNTRKGIDSRTSKPFIKVTHDSTEYEEFVMGSIKNLDKYLIKIITNQKTVDLIQKYIPDTNKTNILLRNIRLTVEN